KSLRFVTQNQQLMTEEVFELKNEMHNLRIKLGGSMAKAEVGEKEQLSIGYRLYFAATGLSGNSYGPTKLHMESFDLAQKMFEDLKPKLDSFSNVKIPKLAQKLEANGAPTVLD
ncbi:MAG: glycosyl hydrolase, partial [Bacteroidota bacterium]|nr:glycosyl hydrolase [Bacteroidota bacterium]